MSAIMNFIERNMEYIEIELIVAFLIAFISGICRQIYKKLKKTVKFREVFSSYIPQTNLPLVTDIRNKVEYDDQSIYFKGSVLKVVVENCSEKNIAIKNAWLVIDQAWPFEERQLVILGHKKNNMFAIYIVNNGYTDIHNIKISLTGNYDVESGKSFLRDEELTKIFSSTVENIHFTISELKSGEIKQISEFLIDVSLLHKYTHGRDWLYICKKVNYDYCYENTDEFLASIVWEQNHLEVIYCQGEGPDVEQYFAEISLKSSFPNKIELPTDFNINSKSCKQIQVVTYVDRSSKIKYHFELETIESKKLISKQNTVNIAVPIYETSGGFFNILREWLIENNIIYYKYNDRPLLQKKIVYRNPIKEKI